MDLGARAEIEFGVGEEVVRTGADNEGAADFGVGYGEGGGGGRGRGAHELLEESPLGKLVLCLVDLLNTREWWDWVETNLFSSHDCGGLLVTAKTV